MKEDYVSSDVAKLLQAKGFDWDVDKFYDADGNLVNRNDLTKLVKAPTHQMAMKWLRKQNLIIRITPFVAWYKKPFLNGYESWVLNLNLPAEDIDVMKNELRRFASTYEEAVEYALKYCLTKIL